MKGSTKTKLHGLWGFRWVFILKLLNQGYNVLMSDIDAIWMNYLDLNNIPDKFDVLHTIAGKVPTRAYMHWGFTVCGCMSAFRPKPKVKRLIKDLIKHCGSSSNRSVCDDQIGLNELYQKRYRMRWKVLPEFSEKLTENSEELSHNGLNFTGTRVGFSDYTRNIFIALAGTELVSRTDFHTMKHMKPEFCEKYNRTWVINPHSEMKVRFEEHDGSENEVKMIEPMKVLEESRSPHTIDSKVQLFRDFGKCFLEETREEFPEVFHKL